MNGVTLSCVHTLEHAFEVMEELESPLDSNFRRPAVCHFSLLGTSIDPSPVRELQVHARC